MRLGRLRTAEWLAATGGVVLLVTLFVLHWYGRVGLIGWWSYPPRSVRLYSPGGAHDHLRPLFTGPRTGWSALSVLRWPLLLTGLAGIAIALLQGLCSGPSLPVVGDLLTSLLAGATTIALLVRLASTAAPLRFGAVLGTLAAAAVTRGAYRAMRVERGWTPGPGRPVPVVPLPGEQPV